MACRALSNGSRCIERRFQPGATWYAIGPPAAGRFRFAGKDHAPAIGGGTRGVPCFCWLSRCPDAYGAGGRLPFGNRLRRARTSVAIRVRREREPLLERSLRALLGGKRLRLR